MISLKAKTKGVSEYKIYREYIKKEKYDIMQRNKIYTEKEDKEQLI